MLYRKVEDQIRVFFKEDKRALLITGARQTGKTFSVRRVGKECFEEVVEINFIEQPSAIGLFSDARDAKDLLLRLSMHTEKPLVPGKTLIFFDEVQECKEIVTAIKFLVDEGSYRYVMSGSLLGVELKDVRSVPVGYMHTIQMYPLDLEEFGIAVGIGQTVFSHLRSCFDKMKPVDEYVHGRMLELVRLYLIVGGMPAAVEEYVNTNNFRKILSVQRDIVNLYRKDISKYDPEHRLMIKEIYNLIPSELNAKNKRFILKNLNEKSRFNRYEGGFVWLTEAGVAIVVCNVEEPKVPLLLNKQRSLFKLFANDVGLLASMYSEEIQKDILMDTKNINFGGIYENLAAQELCAHGFMDGDRELYYFNSKKQGELDFLVEFKGNVLPIEIKSGKDYHRHSALSGVLAEENYDMPEAIVFSNGNIDTDRSIRYLPIYMLMFLHREDSPDIEYKFDLGKLSVF